MCIEAIPRVSYKMVCGKPVITSKDIVLLIKIISTHSAVIKKELYNTSNKILVIINLPNSKYVLMKIIIVIIMKTNSMGVLND